jgi:hypothetical protein
MEPDLEPRKVVKVGMMIVELRACFRGRRGVFWAGWGREFGVLRCGEKLG